MTEQEFVAEQDELLASFPKEIRGALSCYAWERGHSGGYEEVINSLRGLIEIFKKPVQDLVERVQKEAKHPD